MLYTASTFNCLREPATHEPELHAMHGFRHCRLYELRSGCDLNKCFIKKNKLKDCSANSTCYDNCCSGFDKEIEDCPCNANCEDGCSFLNDGSRPACTGSYTCDYSLTLDNVRSTKNKNYANFKISQSKMTTLKYSFLRSSSEDRSTP